MANFALIDNNNIVQTVNVVNNTEAVSGQAFLNSLGLTGTWIQTSYNSRAGVHYTNVPTGTITNTRTISSMKFDPLSGVYTDVQQVSSTITQYTLSADNLPHLRYNYAGVGYTYDSVRDAFIPPKPFNSWVLNESTCNWKAPIEYPSDGKYYSWDELTNNWVLVPGLSGRVGNSRSSNIN